MPLIPDLIKKKRDGGELSAEEIQTFIQAVTNKTIQESQLGTNTTNTNVTNISSILHSPVVVRLRGAADGHLAEGHGSHGDDDPDQRDDVIGRSDVMARGVGGAGG